MRRHPILVLPYLVAKFSIYRIVQRTTGVCTDGISHYRYGLTMEEKPKKLAKIKIYQIFTSFV